MDKLDSILQEMTRLVDTVQVEEYSNRDTRFHHIIAKAAHNRFLLHLFTAIRQFLDQFIRESFTRMPEALNISQQGHHAILAALKERNKRRAAAEMAKHIKTGQDTLQKLHHKRRENLGDDL